MACRCTEKGMCLRDIDRLHKAKEYAGQASENDNGMNSELNGGKSIVPASYTSETEGELTSSIDEVHDKVSDKISGAASEISEAIQRVHEKYEAYCIEDKAFHEEQERLALMGA